MGLGAYSICYMGCENTSVDGLRLRCFATSTRGHKYMGKGHDYQGDCLGASRLSKVCTQFPVITQHLCASVIQVPCTRLTMIIHLTCAQLPIDLRVASSLCFKDQMAAGLL